MLIRVHSLMSDLCTHLNVGMTMTIPIVRQRKEKVAYSKEFFLLAEVGEGNGTHDTK